ncbi:nitroreductase family protein [Pseudonocardia sp. TRM90224]|uniref:nitroreductase family protein n=1 Tax=Pseudonocardia sp. TRM90224 TaxID=2812678 RepID=UPI001E49BDF6|nr:nitroreductase family protein [Pseudonocardia sp. TRM90224]
MELDARKPAGAEPAGVERSAGDEIAEAMRRRRMYREFEDRPVPRDVLARMAWAAARGQQARSGVRHLVVVDDPALMTTARQVLPGFINNAPAMIVHCTDLANAERLLGRRGVGAATRIDAGAACAHLALMAQTLGLGVCTVTSWTDAAVQELLGLPRHIRPDVTVAVGYVPASPPPAARGFVHRLHLNSFGTAFEGNGFEVRAPSTNGAA